MRQQRGTAKGTQGHGGCERTGARGRVARRVLQGKRYLRGWKIDSNLATLRRSERTPPSGGDGAQPHHPSRHPLAPPTVAATQVRPPSLLPSSCRSPVSLLRPSSSLATPAMWPSQDSSIYIEKINIWASSGSFARTTNKPAALCRPGFSPRSPLPFLSLS